MTDSSSLASASMIYLESLNPEQRVAVETLDGPVLMLAGAGTGKTKALTTRIAHILHCGLARPDQILAVTFTNKAAREMQERIVSMVGSVGDAMPFVGTFHAIATRMLRVHAERVGLKPNFTILNTDDQQRLLKQLLQAENIDEKRFPARQLAAHIDGWKNKAWAPQKVKAMGGGDFAHGRGADLYEMYQARLKALNAADFGDLLMECIRLLQDNDDVLALYRARFKYILIDEYQDTNIAQYLWFRLLAGQSANVCCVGDDDQSIYGWRGAEVDNILRFEKDFPDATVIRLERNYRSTGHILSAASALIAHNESRLGKTLFPACDDAGERIQVIGAWDGEEEARLISDEIESLQSKGHLLSDIAILVRASFQMREFEERFVTIGLPYVVIGGPRFYERAEVRDALAYARAIVQDADDLAFERIVNVPKRGIGDATVKALYDYARRAGVPLMVAAEEMTRGEHLKPRVRSALRSLLDYFAAWREALHLEDPVSVMETVLEDSGYSDMWKREGSVEAEGRLENLKELMRSIGAYESLQDFLEHVALVMDNDKSAGLDAVQLMTLHAAKGLEFDAVFLAGWEEGLFPHQRALDESGRKGLEEERRLAYVGVTRAKKRLSISYAAHRRVHGLWSSTVPSRFVDELPASSVDAVETSSQSQYSLHRSYSASRFDGARSVFDQTDVGRGHGGGVRSPGWARAESYAASSVEKVGRTTYSGPTIDAELLARDVSQTETFARGDRVTHAKFGAGVVKEVEGNKLTVAFDSVGLKRVVSAFVQKSDVAL